MKLSPIIPKKHLELIKGRPFYMCLANVCVKDKDYMDFYKKERENGAFILMDNGAGDLDQITEEEILECALYVRPNELILTDTLCDMDKTIEGTFRSMKYYRDNGYTGQFMAVPQGNTLGEWFTCANILINEDVNNEINTFGLSKFMTSHYEDDSARLKGLLLLDKLSDSFFTTHDVHLLGCHNNVDEVIFIDTIFGDKVRSNDTAIAYIYEEANMALSDGENRPSNEIDFVNGDVKDSKLLMENIEFFDNEVN